MLTIARFSERTGLSPSALRFYERKGLLRPAHRRENGYRVYAPGQVAEARFIRSLRAAGVSLADVREFLRLDGSARQEQLARWRREVSVRLLSLQIAEQYLHGLTPDTPQLHLEHWDTPSVLLWFPASAPPGPLPFTSAVAARKKELERLGIPILTGGYARATDLVDGRLLGEVGFRIKPRRRLPREVRVEQVPPVLFATLECTTHDERAAHRIFRLLHTFGFSPAGLHLERYLPGVPDRYLLLIAVRRDVSGAMGYGERQVETRKLMAGRAST